MKKDPIFWGGIALLLLAFALAVSGCESSFPVRRAPSRAWCEANYGPCGTVLADNALAELLPSGEKTFIECKGDTIYKTVVKERLVAGATVRDTVRDTIAVNRWLKVAERQVLIPCTPDTIKVPIYRDAGAVAEQKTTVNWNGLGAGLIVGLLLLVAAWLVMRHFKK